ncbi:MAG: LysM peptidoglycan-binding domain-containing protein [Anaerolineales bacterium]|nr:LysM peptidoglycan-binding domain-containing protein [Anaerolineales bacterium]
MRQVKRLFYLVLLNVIISAITIWVVLNLWERNHPPETSVFATATSEISPTPLVLVVTPTPAEGGEPEAEMPLDTEAEQGSPAPTLVLTPYQVKSGDTLGTIALEFDVSVADILAVNDIPDADTLSIGQVIYIPPGPVPQQSNTPAPTGTITPTPTITPTRRPTAGPSATLTATSPGDEPRVVIASVTGMGSLESERVLLQRTGEGQLSLAGWRLTDEDGNTYLFPQLTLYKGGAINLNTKAGQDTVVDLFWGLSAPVWTSGETVTLVDGVGNVQATFLIP